MNLLTLKLDKLTITWSFAYEHDLNRTVKMLLPMLNLSCTRLDVHSQSDFYVGVALEPQNVQPFINLANYKPVFLISGEPGRRYDTDEAIQFVNAPVPDEKNDDLVRYSPILLQWCPALSQPKRRPMAVIDSGRWPWRNAVIKLLESKLKVPLDKFGKGFGRVLQGYHRTGDDSPYTNDKYIGLRAHAFNLAIENTSAEDYLTEKFYDPILCETVPVYYGCQNLNLWAVNGSYISVQDADKLTEENWPKVYSMMRPTVLKQKKLILSVYNYISYFIKIAEDESLLNDKRILTVETATKFL